jgi:hypothetical protein
VTVDLEALERARDATFRRTPGRRVRGETTALRFINEAGFCTAFSKRVNLPCLWVAICGRRNPRMPVRTHHDYGIGLTWELKDTLPEKRLVFYGRVFRRLPGFVSLEYLPHFYRLFAPQSPLSGELPQAARPILDRLRTHPHQSTAQLRLYGSQYGLRPLSKPAFEKLIAVLQQRFLVVRTEAVYEPKFTYIWDLFERQYPLVVRAGRQLDREEAIDAVLAKYFAAVYYASASDVCSLFGLHAAEARQSLARLKQRGLIAGPVRLRGPACRWWISQASGLGLRASGTTSQA